MTEAPDDHPVILFDGVCNLCTGYVQFLIRRDPDAIFRFAPLQSDVGETLLEECPFDASGIDSIVLVEDGECYVKSAAVLRALDRLGGRYRLLAPAKYLPRVLRDLAYDLVASNRYRVFGRKDECMVPTPDIEARFLAGSPTQPPPDQS